MGTVMDLKDTELCLGLPGGGVDPPTSKYSSNGKRGFSETVDLQLNVRQSANETPAAGGHVNLNDTPTAAAAKEINNLQLPASAPKDPVKPPAKAQVVGWPPVRSYRKNIMATTNTALQSQKSAATEEAGGGTGAAFVKVSIDGAPYLRKVDLKMYKSYQQLSDALGKMFSAFTMGDYGSGTQGGGTIDFMNESKLMDLLNSSDYVPTYEDKDGDWMLVGDVPWEMFVDSCKRLRIMKGSEAIGLAPRAMEKCKSRS